MLGNKTYGNKEKIRKNQPRIKRKSGGRLKAVAEDKEIKLQFELETRKSIKGVRGMPWLSEATKDVTSCEKPRGGANGRRSAGVRMGEPAALEARHQELGPTRGTETSKYPEDEKTRVIPRVAASESGGAQTDCVTARSGLKDSEIGRLLPGEQGWKTRPEGVKAAYPKARATVAVS